MKKTSEEWQKLCTTIIYDPDGWDRSPEGYQYSWYEELITREEFERRLCHSSVFPGRSIFDENGTVNNIWKDK